MTDNTNIKLDGNRLRDFSKTWDGMPMHGFRTKFYIPFLMAIGNIIMDGVACRDTINGVDHGGDNGPAGNAAQVTQRNARIRRIFTVLMSHIDPTSGIYRELERDFQNDGLIALRYIQQDDVGNLPYSPTELAKMNSAWIQLDFTKVPLSRNTVLKYSEKIQLDALEFPTNKTTQEQYDKFLDGLPPQLQQKVLDERTAPNPLFTIPENYPQNANHPLHGQAHPNAGAKDLKKVTIYFSKQWQHMCDHGSVKLPAANEADIDVDANFAGRGKGKGKGKGKGRGRGESAGRGRGGSSGIRKPVREMNNKICCYRCGGLGHVARIQCEDGSTLYCATQIQIEDDILNDIKYPHIPSAAERRAKANSVEAEAPEEEAEDEAMVEAQFAAANLAHVDDDEEDPYAEE